MLMSSSSLPSTSVIRHPEAVDTTRGTGTPALRMLLLPPPATTARVSA